MKENWHDVFSLRFKATMVVLTANVLALTIVTISSVTQTRQLIADDEQRTVRAVVQGVGHAAELPLAVHDERELTHLASRFLTNDQIVFIAIYDNAGKLIAHAQRDAAAWDEYTRHNDRVSNCMLSSEDVEITAADTDFGGDGLEPVSGSGLASSSAATETSTRLGQIVAAVSTGPAEIAQNRQTRLTVAVTATAGAISILLTFFSVGAWTRRLNELADASDQIGKGDFSKLLADRRTDEIGRLARAYEKMRRALRQRETDLRDFNDSLQDQIADRTRSLEDALKAAQAADKAKSLFLANMSHEIRTPLNGVVGMVDLLRGTALDEHQRRFVQVARSSADALLSVINDILDFSKIEAGRIELEAEEIDLPMVVENLAEAASLAAAQKHLEVSCYIAPEVPDKVVGDSTRLGQIITNLCNNAIKFTEKGQILIRGSLVEENDSSALVKFSVTDSGIGIPRDRQNRLFHSFSQADASTTRKYGGTGLGLAICKRLTEMMEGTIGVESEQGKGSTFWFTCRLKKSAARDGMDDLKLKLTTAHPGRVLIVDDNEVNRDILTRQLAVWNMEVRAAADARTALKMFREALDEGKAFDVAILDWHMPEMDGIELARAVRDQKELHGTRLVMLTSVDDRILWRELKELGFAAYLIKPVRQTRLLTVMTEVMDASVTSAEQGAKENPEKAAPPVEAGPGSTVSGPRAAARILMAEDNEINQMVAMEILKSAGHTIDIAKNGAEAVSAVFAKPYDLVLMDCQMPEMDGFEATKAIRDRESKQSGWDGAVSHIPIIALTANAIKGDREICIAAGMDDYVSKPVDPEKLLGAIDRLLGQRTRVTVQQPVAVEPSAVSEGAPVDYSSLVERCMGNSKLADNLLAKFQASIAGDVAKLAEHAAAGNHEALTRLAHTVKGSAANLSAEKVRSIAAELEQMGRQSNLQTADAKLQQLGAEVDRCIAHIEQIKHKAGDGSGARPGNSGAAAKSAASESSTALNPDYRTQPPLDVKELLARCMGNVEFFQRLLAKFRNRLQEDIDCLAGAVSGKDEGETVRLAHSLRGSAANVSAGCLSALAAELEKLGQGNFARAEELMQKIRREADRCRDYRPDLKQLGLTTAKLD